MTRYIIRRLLATVAVLWGISVLIFILVHITPGDAARAQLGSLAPQSAVNLLRNALGLDRPLVVQYGIWLKNALHGNLGYSYQFHISAVQVVMGRFVNTIILAVAALLISVILGLAVGVIAGVRPNSLIDRFTTLGGIFASAVPNFLLGLILIIVFALDVQWFPAIGMHSTNGGGFLDLLHHLVLPAITSAAIPTAVIARTVRSAVLEILNLDYVRTARAKGLTELVVVLRHVLRNALPIFITIVALQAGYLLGGSLITEVIFAWPGMGLQLYTSIGARDVPVIMVITLIIAAIFTGLNLIADLLQGVVDPRVRYT